MIASMVEKYRRPTQEVMDMDVESGEGYDDYLMNSALVTEALVSFVVPLELGYARLRVRYEGENRYGSKRRHLEARGI